MNSDPLADLFQLVVSNSWRAALLILFVVPLRFVLQRRIPARVWFVVWVVVAAQLLLPFTIPATWSPYNVIPTLEPALPAIARTPVAVPSPDAPAVAAAQPFEAALPSAPLAESTLPTARPVDAPSSISPLIGVWIAGLVGLLVARLVVSLRLRRALSKARRIVDARLARIMALENPAGGPAHPPCLETSAINAPALFGALQPRLLFPPGLLDQLSEEELRFVVRHELGHWRRRDLLVHELIHFAAVVHWFNPLVWFAAWLARIDGEHACDEHVLRRETAEGATAYAASLLKVLGVVRGSARTFGVVGILENKQRLADRLRSIADFRRFGWMRTLAGLALVAGLAASAITRESQAADNPVGPSNPLSPRAANAAPADAVAEPGAEFYQQQRRVEELMRDFQAFKEQHQLISPDHSRNLAGQAMSNAHVRVQEARLMVASLEGRLAQIREHRARNGDLTQLPDFSGNTVITQLKQQLAEDRIQLATLGNRYAERHPQMVQLTNIIQAREAEVRRVVDAIVQATATQHEAAVRTLREAESDLQNRTQDVFALERATDEFRAKERALREQQETLKAMAVEFKSAAADRMRPERDAALKRTSENPSPSSSAHLVISVLGSVHQQGVVTLPADNTVIALDAIARAGGFQPIADRTQVELLRVQPDGTRRKQVLSEEALMSGGPSSVLRTGDVIIVPALGGPEPAVINVMGAVNIPGRHEINPAVPMTLIQVIMKAGGASRLADLKKVRITRIDLQTKSSKVVEVNVDDFLRGAANPSSDWSGFVVQPGDIVMVPERIL